jgi:hypothetical protein
MNGPSSRHRGRLVYGREGRGVGHVALRACTAPAARACHAVRPHAAGLSLPRRWPLRPCRLCLRRLPAGRACHAVRLHAAGRPIPHAAGRSGRVASVSVGSEGSGAAASPTRLCLRRERGVRPRETKKLTKNRDWTGLWADSSNYGGFFYKIFDGKTKPWNPCVFYY